MTREIARPRPLPGIAFSIAFVPAEEAIEEVRLLGGGDAEPGVRHLDDRGGGLRAAPRDARCRRPG